MCRGPLNSTRRVFNPPADLPRARTGHPYPLDWWHDNGRADRPGLLRYDNSLPLRLVPRRSARSATPGTWSSTRCSVAGPSPSPAGAPVSSFTGGDVNINAIHFAAPLLAEHAWQNQQPALFAAETPGRPDATAAAYAARDYLPLTGASLLDAGHAAASAHASRRQRRPAEPEPGATVTSQPGPGPAEARDRLLVLRSARQTARTDRTVPVTGYPAASGRISARTRSVTLLMAQEDEPRGVPPTDQAIHVSQPGMGP